MKTGERDYSKGKIYKLVNDVNDDFYVGSTATSLAKRKYWHKTKGRQMPGVKAIFDEIGWDKMKIILVEEWPCENNDQLRQRERYWFDALKPTMNIIRPWVSEEERQEYRQEYRQRPEIKERDREYRQRPEIKERDREYQREYHQRPEVKERRREYQQQPEVKERRREYDQRPEVKERRREYDQRPEVKERQREYDQRPEVKERQREYDQRPEVKERKREYNNRPDRVQQIQCPCGSNVQQRGLQRHERTRKHQRWHAAQQEEEQKDD